MSTKHHEYIVNHLGKYTGSVSTFSFLYKIVDLSVIPIKIQIQQLYPNYLNSVNLKKSRKTYILSFLLPISKTKWLALYNMKYARFGRNFRKGASQVGTQSYSKRDRRYKKGYRVEYSPKYQDFYKQHSYLPWSKLTNETIDILNTEFTLVVEQCHKMNTIGKILIPALICCVIYVLKLDRSLLIFPIFAFLIYILYAYFINPIKIDSKAEHHSKEISNSHMTQDKELEKRYMNYEVINYGFLTQS